MTTPPRIGSDELAARLNLILARHQKVDDPNLDRWEHEPRAALDFITRYSTVRGDPRFTTTRMSGVPRWVAQADAYDAVVLVAWLWWDDRRRELAVLRRARSLDLPSRQIGAPLGITSRQGIRDRCDRLEELFDSGRPDEKRTRAARAGARREQAASTSRERALSAQRQRIIRLASKLVIAADEHGLTDREFCDELADEPSLRLGLPDAEAGQAATSLPRSILALLGLAATEVRTAQAVLALPLAHPVHQLVREVEALRQELSNA